MTSISLQYIDVHTHVNFAAYDADRDETVRRALEAGVGMINVGTQKDTSQKAVELARAAEHVYAIVGVHPIHSDKSHHDEKELGEGNRAFTSRGEAFDAAYYKKLAEEPKVVGIGECGLDYYRLSPGSEKKQKDNFEQHIALANELGKPLMLHVRSGSGRSAYKEVAAMLRSLANVRGNFHFFAGNVEEAKEILELGCTLSFTGVLTFTHDYDEVVRYVPLDRIMAETDAPYVTPVPHRGKRNEPLFVREVVRAIARIKGVEEEAAKMQILSNTKAFFGLA